MTYGQLIAPIVACIVAATTLYVNGHLYFATIFVALGVLLTVWAAALYGRQSRPQAAPLPRLDLVVRHDGRPYVMEHTRSDSETGVVELYQRWYRVGVISDQHVKVHVLLESVVPESEFVYPGHGLQVMSRLAGTEWVDLQPGDAPTVFIDVFTQTIDERSGVPPDETNLLHFCYTNQINRLLPNRRQRVGLRVESGGAFCLRHFVIDFDANGLATFTPD